MVEFVKWLKSLHFSVGGSGSDSNTVEQRAKEVSSKFSTHAFVSLGLMALKQHYVTILPWNIIFKNILCYNVLVSATTTATPSLVSGLCNFRFTVHKYLRQCIRYGTNYNWFYLTGSNFMVETSSRGSVSIVGDIGVLWKQPVTVAYDPNVSSARWVPWSTAGECWCLRRHLGSFGPLRGGGFQIRCWNCHMYLSLAKQNRAQKPLQTSWQRCGHQRGHWG